MALSTENLQLAVELLELPKTAYELAQRRYVDLGEWLGRADSELSQHECVIFPQGSFRLGTAIRPLVATEEYDLDLACEMTTGFSTTTVTQEQLKTLVGRELEGYRRARSIAAPLEEKHRCWRLEYRDTLAFHMDVVPCIPATDTRREDIYRLLVEHQMDRGLAEAVSGRSVAITDNRHPTYRRISDDWPLSNPEGFAKWFVGRMNQGIDHVLLERIQQANIPHYARKTVLQRIVQLLKRHRDVMYLETPDLKPISVIISTLAARSYMGQQDLGQALSDVLQQMGEHVQNQGPRIPNPVNPAEDFADRWYTDEGRRLGLEKNFWIWLESARNDFAALSNASTPDELVERARSRLQVQIAKGAAAERGEFRPTTPRGPVIITREAAKPWRRT